MRTRTRCKSSIDYRTEYSASASIYESLARSATTRDFKGGLRVNTTLEDSSMHRRINCFSSCDNVGCGHLILETNSGETFRREIKLPLYITFSIGQLKGVTVPRY